MSIEKYLEQIKLPDTPSGPFGVRLKYELKKDIFDNKRSVSVFVYVSSFAALAFFTLAMSLIVRPDLAQKINYAFQSNDAELDQMLQNDQVFATSRNESIPVKDLSQLDEQKSYMIRRVKGKSNKNLYYVSEVQNEKRRTKVAY